MSATEIVGYVVASFFVFVGAVAFAVSLAHGQDNKPHFLIAAALLWLDALIAMWIWPA